MATKKPAPKATKAAPLKDLDLKKIKKDIKGGSSPIIRTPPTGNS